MRNPHCAHANVTYKSENDVNGGGQSQACYDVAAMPAITLGLWIGHKSSQ